MCHWFCSLEKVSVFWKQKCHLQKLSLLSLINPGCCTPASLAIYVVSALDVLVFMEREPDILHLLAQMNWARFTVKNR